MAKITINEIDNTLFSAALAASDNIVFVPGISADGEANTCYLFNTTSEFINVVGNRPANSDKGYMTSWDYAYNLLDHSMPVLFYRVVPSETDIANMKKAYPLSNSEVAKAASSKISGNNAAGTAEEFATISYKNVGTNGNQYAYMFTESSTSVYLKVYRHSSPNSTDWVCIESIKVCNKASVEDLPKDFTAGLTKIKSDYVTVTVTDPTAPHYFTAVESPIQLTGGTDPDKESVNYVLGKDYEVNNVFNHLTDKFLRDVKFVTAGGSFDTFITTDYSETNEETGETVIHSPADNKFPISANLIKVAEIRKDAIAIPDMPIGVPIEDIKYFLVPGYEEGASNTGFNSSYATAYAPWGYMELTSGDMWCPPSFIFLYRLALSLEAGNSIWQVPAGINRATISNMTNAEYEVGQQVADNWQKSSRQFINPIAKINQYGYVIWGNKTLYNPPDDENGNTVTSALSDISVRIVANEIKRNIFRACLELTFEKNTIHTWNAFRSKIKPQLTSMKDSGVIYGYQIVMGGSTISDEDIAQNRIRGAVRVSIARTAEDFDIDFVLEPAGVTFENEDVF